MSNFKCPECGAVCIDSPNGYVTGCEHYPVDVKPVPDKPLSVDELMQIFLEVKNETN